MGKVLKEGMFVYYTPAGSGHEPVFGYISSSVMLNEGRVLMVHLIGQHREILAHHDDCQAIPEGKVDIELRGLNVTHIQGDCIVEEQTTENGMLYVDLECLEDGFRLKHVPLSEIVPCWPVY